MNFPFFILRLPRINSPRDPPPHESRGCREPTTRASATSAPSTAIRPRRPPPPRPSPGRDRSRARSRSSSPRPYTHAVLCSSDPMRAYDGASADEGVRASRSPSNPETRRRMKVSPRVPALAVLRDGRIDRRGPETGAGGHGVELPNRREWNSRWRAFPSWCTSASGARLRSLPTLSWIPRADA